MRWIWLLVVTVGCVAVPEDVRDVCLFVADAVCERAADCGDMWPENVPACRSASVEACCDQYECGTPIVVERDEWADCVRAMEAAPCSISTPAECVEVIAIAY